MAKNRKEVEETPDIRPAFSAEQRENQMIALAMDLAEKKLRDGTASNQTICHFLKLGSMKERLDRENLQEEINLKVAKREALQSSKDLKELYVTALRAMRSYSGTLVEVDEDIF